MAKTFNISNEPEPSSHHSSQSRPTSRVPTNSAGGQGAAGIEVTPPIIAAAVLVVVLLLVGLFFWRPGALGAAATPMMDTSTQSLAPGEAATHANGMDSSTGSSNPATNNGMDTSTGR